MRFIKINKTILTTTTEHAGESGVQLSVGAKMEAYGGQGKQLQATNYTASLGRSQCKRKQPTTSTCDCQPSVVQ